MEYESKKELNKEFRDYYLASSIPSMKGGILITLLLFLFYAVANRLIFGTNPEQQYFLRFGLIAPILIISLALLYIPGVRSKLGILFTILNFFSCVAIYFVGISSDIHSPGYNYFFVWVMLIMIGMHTFYRIGFRELILLSILQLSAYLAACLFNNSFSNLLVFINNLFFVISMTSLGFFISWTFQSLNWKNFLHQKALRDNYRKLVGEMHERRSAEEELSKSERKYHEALDSFPDWVMELDREMNIIMVNSTMRDAAHKAGFPEELTGLKFPDIFPFINREQIEETMEVFKTGKIVISEINVKHKGRDFLLETRKIPVIRDNSVEHVMVVTRDRSSEKEIEALRLKNAEQKEIMIKEIHHRVKNNLAIVISLLGMQEKKHPDKDLSRIMKDIELRIRSMALIHEHFYRSEQLDRIPLASYLYALANIISGTFSSTHIRLETRFDEIIADIETALPLGLITNELLTNAYKYAFTDKIGGVIRVSIEKDGSKGFFLKVRDNGKGLPADFDLEKQDSLGMFIVKLLVEQLDGNIRIESKNGVESTIYIPFN